VFRSLLILVVVVAVAGGAPLAAQGELVLQKEGTSLYHRPGCPVVRDGKGVLALSRAQAESRGLQPHDACDPAKAAPAGSGGKGEPARTDEAVAVLLDESKYYHREGCRKLEGKTRRMDLEAAGKARWPCPACKPPIRKRSGPSVPPRVRDLPRPGGRSGTPPAQPGGGAARR
jgi:hypothetical protein